MVNKLDCYYSASGLIRIEPIAPKSQPVGKHGIKSLLLQEKRELDVLKKMTGKLRLQIMFSSSVHK